MFWHMPDQRYYRKLTHHPRLAFGTIRMLLLYIAAAIG